MIRGVAGRVNAVGRLGRGRRGTKGGPDPQRSAYFTYEVVVDLGDEGWLLPALHEVGAKLTPSGFADVTYRYHSGYGDPPREMQPLTIKKATVADDGRAVTLEVEGLKPYYVHELRLGGVRSRDGQPLLHPEAYYTLNPLPK